MRLFFISFFISIVFNLLPSISFAAANKISNEHVTHIIIDPGHGGKDRGATFGKIVEANITLAIAKNLSQLLKDNPGIELTMTRNTDSTVSLDERTEIANQKHADLFISIHANSADFRTAQGAEFYFQNQLPPDEDTMFLASRENGIAPKATILPIRRENPGMVGQILEDLVRNRNIFLSSDLVRSLRENWSGKQNRRQKTISQAPFRVISNVQMPAALIEVGFINHPQEGPLLTDPAQQKKMAKSIYNGILQFKEKLDKESAQH